MTDNTPDPFAGGDSAPAVSWAVRGPDGSYSSVPVGTTVVMHVTDEARLVQSRNFDDGKPKFWDDGNPQMSAVVVGTVNGETKSIWASKPSSMFTAIKTAQDVAGSRISKGGILTVRLEGFKQGEDKNKAPAKQYTATYQAANVFATADLGTHAQPGDAAAIAAMAPPPPPPAAAMAPPPPPPAPVAIATTPEGYTLASLISAGWTREQAVAAYPILGGPPAPPQGGLSPEERAALNL